MVTVSVGAYHSWRKTHPDWPPRGKWWLWIALDRIAFCALATLAITFLVRFVTPATPESAPATPQPKQSSPPIVPQDKPPLSPVKPVHAPIQPPVEQPRLPPSATWAQRGFNISTKAALPIAVIAPNGKDPNHYLDNHVVGSISSLLSQDLNLVLPEDAALFVEITEARVGNYILDKPTHKR
jgi:hypothetical protein